VTELQDVVAISGGLLVVEFVGQREMDLDDTL
jgi:hypothetical protein